MLITYNELFSDKYIKNYAFLENSVIECLSNSYYFEPVQIEENPAAFEPLFYITTDNFNVEKLLDLTNDITILYSEDLDLYIIPIYTDFSCSRIEIKGKE